MKKLVIGVIIGLSVATGFAYAGLLDSMATSDWPIKKSKKYKIDMYGYDARAYEFDTDNGMTCVAVYSGGEQRGFQMACRPVR